VIAVHHQGYMGNLTFFFLRPHHLPARHRDRHPPPTKGIPPNQGRIEPTPDSRTMARHSAGASRAILALAVASLCLCVQVSAALGPNSQLLLRSPSVAPRAAASSGSLLQLKGGFEPQCGRRLRIALCAWESLHSIAVSRRSHHFPSFAIVSNYASAAHSHGNNGRVPAAGGWSCASRDRACSWAGP
jgi:hypothetical protein